MEVNRSQRMMKRPSDDANCTPSAIFSSVRTRHSQVLAQVLIANSTELMPSVSSPWDEAETCQMDDRK